MKTLTTILSFITVIAVSAQMSEPLKQFTMFNDVMITIDAPAINRKKETIIILYALPNGNTTAQTMGKKKAEGLDWHFDIQHIKAQTRFVRDQLPTKNIVVIYLENDLKSWPLWKSKHPDFIAKTQHIVDTLLSLFNGSNKTHDSRFTTHADKLLYLNGHSGGGRFIFNWLDGVTLIPSYVKNISFLDSNYGYDSAYLSKFTQWIKQNKDARLNVFAYNDSVALLNGKRFVSDTGGTWYRSHLMLKQLSRDISFSQLREDSLVVYRSDDKKINFFFKTNPEKKIFHTQQVELNGFIHSILVGTKRSEMDYRYFGKRAYEELIE